jgi:hypothetical protein
MENKKGNFASDKELNWEVIGKLEEENRISIASYAKLGNQSFEKWSEEARLNAERLNRQRKENNNSNN